MEKKKKKTIQEKVTKKETCPANACQVLQDMWDAGGGAYDKSSKYCKACAKDFPETKTVCEARTTEAIKTKATMKKSPGKIQIEKVGYGHRKGTQAAFIDDLLKKGTTLTGAVAAINKAGLNVNGQDEKTMVRRFLRHVDDLQRCHGLKIVKKDGLYQGPKA